MAIDGENKQYEATTFFQTDDEHTEVMVILYDLTTVLKVERMQADFLANASHEFKTPLTAITGFAETLQGSAGEDQSIREQFLQIISDETKKLTLLVNDVLSLSKIKHEPDRNTEERINLYMLVQEQWQSIQHLVIKNDIKLVNDIPDNFEVVTFKNDLTIIVKNLLANAVKYNRENGQVRLSAQKTADHWSFSVRDTGIGIPTNQQARVFERFYRGDESRQKTIADGTGLGLAIVNELLAKHQGNIKLNSQVGVGTTFTVIFPNK
ncbi:sensor histidine kinase [Leuconostoc fallax]|uniref:sensor histidine kinase n=1 Tax=Leuconostoc fallax TaxID=1251 RepID=UPI0002E69562|nr:HAMP domain-containing sensor histidine kinase [Leuconostoc fallax]